MKLKNVKIKIPGGEKVAPFVSGTASLGLLAKIIFSEIEGIDLYVSLGCVLLIFLGSIFLFGYLSKIEKEKDMLMLKMVGGIVDAVFKEYGKQMAEKDAASTADKMNPIMQSVVNLIKEMRTLSEKGYKK